MHVILKTKARNEMTGVRLGVVGLGLLHRADIDVATLASFFGRGEVSEGDVSRASDGAGASRGQRTKVSTPGTIVTSVKDLRVTASTICLDRLRPITSRRIDAAAGAGKAIFVARLEEDGALLRAVRWRRCKGASLWRKPPFLDVCLDEDEAGLAKIDMYHAGAVGTN